ncbi:MAG TPA: hypothetical protein VFV19_10435 [Candidatus Polarisedimenticolaceae bacterium]|nr:hypothetical protein [Candidatus Polarisedimenticolaceae bacterium]
MSRLAGFDLSIEITADAILRLIESTVTNPFDGTPLVAPFELSLVAAHLIVETLTLTADEPGNAFVLGFVFDDSTVFDTQVFGAPLISSATVDSLDGTISFRIPVQNTPAGSAEIVPFLDFASATISVDFSPGSDARLTAAGETPANVEAKAASLVRLGVSGMKPIALDKVIPFTLVAAGDGQLYPTDYTDPVNPYKALCASPTMDLEFVSVRAFAKRDAVTSQDFLVVFGEVIAQNVGNGDPSQKTTTSLSAGDDLCISLSPEIFKRFFFCPAISCALTTAKLDDKKHVQSQCGTDTIDLGSDRKLTRLDFQFQDGSIALDIAGRYEPTCLTGVAQLPATLTFQVAGGAVALSANFGQLQFQASVDDWCWALAGIFGGPVGLAVAGALQAIADSFGSRLDDFVKSFADFGATGGLFKLPQATVNDVVVTPEDLTFGATGTVALPAGKREGLALVGSAVPVSQTAVPQPDGNIQGTLSIPAGCMAGDYPFTEYSQQIVATYQAVPTLLGQPLQFEWRVSAGATTVLLAPGSGTLEIPDVDTLYDLSTIPVTQPVHLDYSLGPDTLTLRNHPGEGTFWIGIDLLVTDPVGRTAEALASTPIKGDEVDIGGGYLERLQYCLRKLMDEIKAAVTPRPIRVPPWVPVNYPAPDVLTKLITAVAAVGGPAAEQFLVFARLAHGTSFYRALFANRFGPQLSAMRRRQSIDSRELSWNRILP